MDMIKEISEEMDLPFHIVKEACNAQFKLVKDAMDEGDKFIFDSYKSIRLFKLGTFFPRKIKIAKDAKRLKETPEIFDVNKEGKIIIKIKE